MRTFAFVIAIFIAGILHSFENLASDNVTSGCSSAGEQEIDFSFCGYKGGGIIIPEVPVRLVVEPPEGDATELIQAAIDSVSSMEPDEEGFRGTILLARGTFRISGQLRIVSSGVVLRGTGNDEEGTLLIATGNSRRTLINIGSWKEFQELENTRQRINSEYLPAGASGFEISSVEDLQPGDEVMVHRPSTKEWIHVIEMDQFKAWHANEILYWQEGTRDLYWERIVTGIEGNRITLDAPLTTALDARYGGGELFIHTWPDRVENCGVENLRCVSETNPSNPLDEEHSWVAVQVLAADNSWVRNVSAVHFASSAVSLEKTSRKVTVADCHSISPVSEIGGMRRHSFYAGGQQGLFLRCTAEQGRHDFAAGLLAAGPNVFLDCSSTGAYNISGPIESWASGVLYDNVEIADGNLQLGNRGYALQGMGWAAANCVLWNCVADTIYCEKPPTASNLAMGCQGERVGDGNFRSHGIRVSPESLYRQQLQERLGEKAVLTLDPAQFSAEPGKASRFTYQADLPGQQERVVPLEIINGWFVHDGKVVWGGRTGPSWYQGYMMPERKRGRNIVRWSPTKTGAYLTEDLDQMVEDLLADQSPWYGHSYGLWYERRRVNHDTVRRPDGEVWPPFLEQPWARSGKGTAWDGLSKYDLTSFNPWYFSRMREFAGSCDKQGAILSYNCFEQHNIIESRSHWVDAPWRGVNCLQDTEMPHTIPVFKEFYDTSHSLRMELQQLYLRKVLDELGEFSHVVYMPSKEFTGPISWLRMWVDTMTEWERKNSVPLQIGLMGTKDVIDDILKDPIRGPLISVIDMSLWWYLEDGTLYAPEGNRQMAPRQYEAEFRLRTNDKNPLSQSPEQVYRKVREYRELYPEKAIISSGLEAGAWPVLMAGGSMYRGGLGSDPDRFIYELINNHLYNRLQYTLPADLVRNNPEKNWCLADNDGLVLAFASGGGVLDIDLSGMKGKFLARWFDPATGKLEDIGKGRIKGGKELRFDAPSGENAWLLWLDRVEK